MNDLLEAAICDRHWQIFGCSPLATAAFIFPSVNRTTRSLEYRVWHACMLI